MPLNKNLKKVLVIGSGPIVIGQAAEFDYAGTQACRALKEDGLEVVLVNSNPATIMTDHAMADHIYIEPLTLPVIKRIIQKERPDSLLSTLGGQTGLNLSMQLAKDGFLDEHGVQLLGAKPATIDKAEDRQLFKDTMEEIGQPVIPSKVVTTLADAIAFSEVIGFPLIIRPAFTLGGTGGGIAHDLDQLKEIAATGLRMSPIGQILVEQSVAGWKEIEFEVMRDSMGNVITICSMENFDPVGVHTGDSIVIAPAVTLSNQEYQLLRTAALDIVNALEVEGGCNCQFALDPDSFDYRVIEVNPRVSRSSALASKATGYPIAKVATKIAIGYTLDEITNAVTGKTSACFEPSIDYVVVKFPKWPFDKFVYAKRELGTQMKATGEVMAIGTSFEQAIMKAVRSTETGLSCLRDPHQAAFTDAEISAKLNECTDERIFVVYEALHRGISVEEIFTKTKIDRWFLHKLRQLVEMDRNLAGGFDEQLYLRAKHLGYLDKNIEQLSGQKVENPRRAVFKMVDTCAAEFEAQTPYFYSTYDEENEAELFIAKKASDKKRVIVFGSGPIRIGQGIEFDYASVHCVWSLKKAGYEVIIVNNNPETVSTDFDTADRLYFEPLTPEDVANIIATEQPWGVVVSFGGQTAIKLTQFLEESGVRILGTSADSIDMAEDRQRFDDLLENLQLLRPQGLTVTTTEQALAAAAQIGYPVLMRPSYVLGGQNMIIAFNEADIEEYMQVILTHNADNLVLIDKYLSGIELEVDAICDGEEILIPGIMEHIERAGIHSGDSIAVYPAWKIDDAMTETIVESTYKLATALKVKGLVNIQYLIENGTLYIIEVNPRSSRTIPYISKVTGVPMVDLATRCMLGEKLRDLGYGTGLYKESPYVAVKVPVFSFEKLTNVDNQLGPEMKSTGEVLGVAATIEEALYKGLRAAGYRMEKEGGVFITVRDQDKAEIMVIAKKFFDLGFTIYATQGTAQALAQVNIEAQLVERIHEGENNGLALIESGAVNYVISTSTKGRLPTADSVKMRRKAVERNIPCLALDTADALADCLHSRYSQETTELVDINRMRRRRQVIPFTKTQTCGNDYIFINCLDGLEVANPESLSIRLCNRHFSIGADGLGVVRPSQQADAALVCYDKEGRFSPNNLNALLCAGKFLYDSGLVPKRSIRLETECGIRHLEVQTRGGKAQQITVTLGPCQLVKPEQTAKTLHLDGVEYPLTCVDIGSKHHVVFADHTEYQNLKKAGAPPESLLGEIEFVQVLDERTLMLRHLARKPWEERSSGTGCCAAGVAAVLRGYCDKNTPVTVKLREDDQTVRFDGERAYFSGLAITCIQGSVEV